MSISSLRESKNVQVDIETYINLYSTWSHRNQVEFVSQLVQQMCHSQQSQVNDFLCPLLMRDFITLLSRRGLVHVAEKILLYLDADSLLAAEKVCKSWANVIEGCILWKKIIEHKMSVNTLWHGIVKRCNLNHFLNMPTDLSNCPTFPLPNAFYRNLYERILQCIKDLDENWLHGSYETDRIYCHSETSKGVYCLQYDEKKIICGLRDNTIKIWDRFSNECNKTLQGHTGSVLCLQYDDEIIVSGSSDYQVRVWSIDTAECLNVIYHHCEAVLHLKFVNKLMVTCSKDKSIALWNIISPKEIHLKHVLIGHRAAVNVVDFDMKYIVSASGDRTIKVWNTSTYSFVRTLTGHRRGIACLQYRDGLIVSGSSDNTIRLWNVEMTLCLRVLEGHKDLVRCIRFDQKRIISGSYDGEIKVWDMQSALNPCSPSPLCILTLSKHNSRVFRLQFDDFQIISSSHDDSIIIWDFFPTLHALHKIEVNSTPPSSSSSLSSQISSNNPTTAVAVVVVNTSNDVHLPNDDDNYVDVEHNDHQHLSVHVRDSPTSMSLPS